MTKTYKMISILVLITLLLTNVITFIKYNKIKQAETTSYSQLVDRFYSYGISLSYDSILLVNGKIRNGSINEEDVRVWLNEIVSDMKVSAETASIADNHWNLTIGDKNEYDSVGEISQFYKSIQINLNDIIKTEKDYTVLKQACIELEEILEIIKNNTNEQKLISADYKEIKIHWKELMELVHEKHSNSRLLKSYFLIYYS